jgi:hypothetical protein
VGFAVAGELDRQPGQRGVTPRKTDADELVDRLTPWPDDEDGDDELVVPPE